MTKNEKIYWISYGYRIGSNYAKIRTAIMDNDAYAENGESSEDRTPKIDRNTIRRYTLQFPPDKHLPPPVGIFGTIGLSGLSGGDEYSQSVLEFSNKDENFWKRIDVLFERKLADSILFEMDKILSDAKPCYVFIQGPVLPKLAGRLALRFPSKDITIVFITFRRRFLLQNKELYKNWEILGPYPNEHIPSIGRTYFYHWGKQLTNHEISGPKDYRLPLRFDLFCQEMEPSEVVQIWQNVLSKLENVSVGIHPSQGWASFNHVFVPRPLLDLSARLYRFGPELASYLINKFDNVISLEERQRLIISKLEEKDPELKMAARDGNFIDFMDEASMIGPAWHVTP